MKKFLDNLITSPVVFFSTAIASILFVVTVIIVGAPASELFSKFQSWMSTNFGWFINLTINYSLIFILFLMFSNKYGNIKLGGTEAIPEFSRFSWVSMLFSAGMGIGLLYFSVAEPMFHYTNPIESNLTTNQNMQMAMNITFFHYGLHVWALYAVVGLSMAYFCFSRKMPLSISSTLVSVLPDKFHFILKPIDALASIATLFGLATSLGFGSKQFCAGLSELFGIANTQSNQVIAISVITFIATISIITGLKKGVKILSNLNMLLALILFTFVLLVGPTVKMIDFSIQSIGSYFQNFIGQSFERGEFSDSAGFFKGWSMFYWAWWVSWSPFVGTFIARISKGRTIREFIFFVLLAPSIISFIWLAVFGGNAFNQQALGLADFTAIIKEDSSKALFAMLANLPLKEITSFLAILLVSTFFITSSDSGSLVVDYMTSGGNINTPTSQKIFWASMEGLIAIALILGGGLSALQAASISTGFPFAIILILMTYSLYKSLNNDIRSK